MVSRGDRDSAGVYNASQEIRKIKNLMQDVTVFTAQQNAELLSLSESINERIRQANVATQSYLEEKQANSKKLSVVYSGQEILSEYVQIYGDKFELAFRYIEDIYQRQEKISESLKLLCAYVERQEGRL